MASENSEKNFSVSFFLYEVHHDDDMPRYFFGHRQIRHNPIILLCIGERKMKPCNDLFKIKHTRFLVRRFVSDETNRIFVTFIH
jgi:hypothetical protein